MIVPNNIECAAQQPPQPNYQPLTINMTSNNSIEQNQVNASTVLVKKKKSLIKGILLFIICMPFLPIVAPIWIIKKMFFSRD